MAIDVSCLEGECSDSRMEIQVDECVSCRPHVDAAQAHHPHKDKLDFIDIRSQKDGTDLGQILRQALNPSDSSEPRFPSLLLWNEDGLKHFEAITYTPEYYLMRSEISILKQHCSDVARLIRPGSILMELGSGNLRKTKFILDALDELGCSTDYYALDLDRSELERTLRLISPTNFNSVRCHGLLGTYDDARSWLDGLSLVMRPKCIMSLGSSVGSFNREEAAKFISNFTSNRHGSTNEGPRLFLLGLDGCKSKDRVHSAYNDPAGSNAKFIFNALRHSNAILGYGAFDEADWKVHGEWEEEVGRHTQYLIPKTETCFEGRCFLPGKKIPVVSSHKYDQADQRQLFRRAGVRQIAYWSGGDGSYGFHALIPDVPN